jgi:glycosyltransferase involved in cell wall biosynthesis
MNQPNSLPPTMSVADMDLLVQRTSLRRYPRIPTAVGFCMLMSREAIQAVGPFDMAFGRGYGEEVDWCQRAWLKGFEAALCDDLYVYHKGEASFATVQEAGTLREGNQQLFRQRWPLFDSMVRQYCAVNPLRFQQHRLFHALRNHGAARLRVQHVVHSFEDAAGIETFTRRLVDKMHGDVESTVVYPAVLPPYFDAIVHEEGRGLLAGALLRVKRNAGFQEFTYTLRGNSLQLRSPHAERAFAEMLLASRADIVQFGHYANHGSLALPLVAHALGVKVLLVLHDYFLLCPDVNLLHASGKACDEARASADSNKCLDCLGRRIESAPKAGALDLPQFLRRRHQLVQAAVQCADMLIAPSHFVRDQYARAFGSRVGDRIRIVRHGTEPYPFVRSYAPQSTLRVAFLGNAAYVKGIETFLAAARMLRDEPIRMTVLGEPLRDVGVQDVENVSFRGSYVARELPRILQEFDVACICSIVHETYCLTLDETLRAGTPVIATRMGAIPERLQDGRTGILVPPGDADALREALLRLERDRALLASLRANVAQLVFRTVDDVARDYLAAYQEMLAETQTQYDGSAVVQAARTPALPHCTTFAQYAVQHGLDIGAPLVAEHLAPGTRSSTKPDRRR